MIAQINQLRKSLGNRKLKKIIATAPNRTKVTNFYDADHIGIVFNATNSANFDIVRKLVKKLESDYNKVVNVLGFVHSKGVIDQYLIIKDFDFFTLKDLNWLQFPSKNEAAINFINTPFDILLNLSVEDFPCLNYLVASSKAQFKVSKNYAEVNYADLLIEINNSKSEFERIQKQTTNNQENNTNQVIDFKYKEGGLTFPEAQLKFLIEQSFHYLQVVRSK